MRALLRRARLAQVPGAYVQIAYSKKIRSRMDFIALLYLERRPVIAADQLGNLRDKQRKPPTRADSPHPTHASIRRVSAIPKMPFTFMKE